MKDAITKLLVEQSTDLINANVSGIAEELRDDVGSKLTVSISCKLTIVGGKLHAGSSIAYSRKFKDDVEGTVDLDKNQLKLIKEDE